MACNELKFYKLPSTYRRKLRPNLGYAFGFKEGDQNHQFSSCGILVRTHWQHRVGENENTDRETCNVAYYYKCCENEMPTAESHRSDFQNLIFWNTFVLNANKTRSDKNLFYLLELGPWFRLSVLLADWSSHSWTRFGSSSDKTWQAKIIHGHIVDHWAMCCGTYWQSEEIRQGRTQVIPEMEEMFQYWEIFGTIKGGIQKYKYSVNRDKEKLAWDSESFVRATQVDLKVGCFLQLIPHRYQKTEHAILGLSILTYLHLCSDAQCCVKFWPRMWKRCQMIELSRKY
ncbi:hypothetical protein MIR68_006740 [Amoeboaphelidium protococcarum]|nr:hypothetical protein MIR68_006740 [Amoeboaphelidium protococcarum]